VAPDDRRTDTGDEGSGCVRWVRMSTDVPTAIREVLHGRLSLREYLRSIRPPVAPAIYASDDPLPGVLEVPLLAYLVGKRSLAVAGSHERMPNRTGRLVLHSSIQGSA